MPAIFWIPPALCWLAVDILISMPARAFSYAAAVIGVE